MTESAETLFPEIGDGAPAETYSTGILPSHGIRALIRDRHIRATADMTEVQIQPASLDLRLGSTAYRVRASFLPGSGHSVRQRIDALGMHEIDLRCGAVLERGCVYIVPLMESLHLGKRLSAVANPKSSTGRLDVFTRLITDHATEFDRVREAYKGPLYAEISPCSFSILVREGSRLNQLRFQRGSPRPSDTALRRLDEEVRLVHREEGRENIANGIAVTVDLCGTDATGMVGFRAKRHTDLIDIDKVAHYDPAQYWERLYATEQKALILDPNDFYILASKEAVTVPPDHAAEMVAFDTLVGEFRVHYAGFFDPGFGHDDSLGTRAVLEVRSREVPFVIEDGQVVGRLVYERLTETPSLLYGAGLGSHYQAQGLKLSKHFG